MLLALLLCTAQAAEVDVTFTASGVARQELHFRDVAPGPMEPFTLLATDGARIISTINVSTNPAGDYAFDITVVREEEMGRRKRIRSATLMHPLLFVRAGQKGSVSQGVAIPHLTTAGIRTQVVFNRLIFEVRPSPPPATEG